MFVVPLRKVDLGVAQAHALDLDQGCLELGEGLQVLARGPHHELMAAAQHDGPAPAIEAFDDGPRDALVTTSVLAVSIVTLSILV